MYLFQVTYLDGRVESAVLSEKDVIVRFRDLDSFPDKDKNTIQRLVVQDLDSPTNDAST